MLTLRIAMLICRMALEGTAVLLITHRDEIAETADAAPDVRRSGDIHRRSDRRRRYFSTCACPPLSPSDLNPGTDQPEVRDALASNGNTRIQPTEECQ
jgi:hypothetical protein